MPSEDDWLDYVAQELEDANLRTRPITRVVRQIPRIHLITPRQPTPVGLPIIAGDARSLRLFRHWLYADARRPTVQNGRRHAAGQAFAKYAGTRNVEEAMEAAWHIVDHFQVGHPATPALLSMRIFQRFLKRPFPELPEDMGLLCCQAADSPIDYGDLALAKWDRSIKCYDRRSAYGAELLRLPDLTRGVFRKIKQPCWGEYSSPIGIYRLSDPAGEYGVLLSYYPVWTGFSVHARFPKARIVSGWYWEGDPLGEGPFARTVRALYYWQGSAVERHLAHRLIALLPGKFGQHGKVRDGILPISVWWRPLITKSVIGGCAAHILKVLKDCRGKAAHVDMVYVTASLPAEMIGDDIGMWREVT